MICKHCGAKYEAGVAKCPKCGNEIGTLEGGNGFWDIARGEQPQNSSNTQKHKTVETRSVNKGHGSTAAYMGLLVSVLCIVALGIVFAVLKGEITKKQSETDERLSSLEQSINRVTRSVDETASALTQIQAEENRNVLAGESHSENGEPTQGLPSPPFEPAHIDENPTEVTPATEEPGLSGHDDSNTAAGSDEDDSEPPYEPENKDDETANENQEDNDE